MLLNKPTKKEVNEVSRIGSSLANSEERERKMLQPKMKTLDVVSFF